MHVRRMNTVPAIVASRNTHLSRVSGEPPSAPCQKSGARNRLSVAATNPPIHKGGNIAFIRNVWADERSRGDGFSGGFKPVTWSRPWRDVLATAPRPRRRAAAPNPTQSAPSPRRRDQGQALGRPPDW